MDEKVIARFWSKVEKGDGCWLWRGSKKNRYGGFWDGLTNVLAHRFAWLITNGDAGDQFVLHACDNPLCVKPKHLSLGTQADNMLDRNRKNRQAKAERNGNNRWSTDDVIRLRQMVRDGSTIGASARSIGMPEGTARCIIERRSWKHLP